MNSWRNPWENYLERFPARVLWGMSGEFAEVYGGFMEKFLAEFLK